ncbi:MAG: choice-of-anchor D domain-containing protein [Planctomycetota bacterium]
MQYGMIDRGVLSVLVLVFASLTAAGLAAQSPPYGGYTNSPYTTGTGSNDYMDTVVIRRGTTTLLTNANTGPSASPYNPFYGSIAPANLIPGVAHQIDITVSPSWSQGMTVFIDYNNDGDFVDSNETVGYTPVISSGGTGTVTFTPATGFGGVLRMRIRCIYYTAGPFTATQSETYGEAEDYLVNLGFAITTDNPLPTGAETQTYSTTIQATNGASPYTWDTNITGLPPGVTASQPTGSDNLILSSSAPLATGTANTYNFTVSVTDSASATANKSFTISVTPPPAALPFTDDFSGTGNTWLLSGSWQVGAATAYSASATTSGPARSEPGTDTSASTDNRILGHAIGADYTNNMSEQTATAPPVNCGTATNVQLRFQRWLGVASIDLAKIQITNNGSTWNDVWSSSGGTVNSPNAWVPVAYDITQWAAGNSVVQVRFVLGPTDASIINVGWCIDDFQILDPGPALEVTEGPTPVNTITDDQAVGGLRDFGQVNLGANSQVLEITFTNNGTSTITIPTFTKTGADPAKFVVIQSPASSIAIGASTVMQIQFNSNAGGTTGAQGFYYATIEVDHNATGAGVGTAPFEINLQAEGVVPTPIISVNENSASGTAITHNQPAGTTIRNFGSQDIANGQTAAITLAITNVGTGTLSIGGINIGGTNFSDFVIDTTGLTFPLNLTANQTATFTVAFDPATIGQKDAVVQFSHNDSAQPTPFLIPITGVGTQSGVPIMSVTEGSGGANIPYNDPAANGRDFGQQLINNGPTNPPLTITITNSGSVNLNITSMPVLGGPDAAHFVLDITGFSTPIGSGASSSFTIAFDPTSLGIKDATVTFSHDDSSITSPFIINVTGEGVNAAPAITVRENSAGGNAITSPAAATGILNFGGQDISVGPTAPAVIYIENSGTAPMNVGMPVFNPATTEFQIQATGFPMTLAIGASTTFSITFDPTAQGPQTATVEFTHNGLGTPSPFQLNVAGTGVLNAPLVEVREASTTGPTVASGAVATLGGGRDCGSINVTAGATAPITIVILNTGTQDLTLGNPTITGVNAADFVVTTTGIFNTTVTAGNSTQFTVAMDPTLGGIKDAQIEFTQDDTTQPSPFIVKVTGTAIDPSGVLITTTTLPSGVANSPYGPVQLAAIQGAAPYTWSIYNGNLPAGVTLSTTGQLTGTPIGLGGNYTFRVRVTDQTGATNERQFSLLVDSNLSGRGRAAASGCAANAGSSSTMIALLALLGLIGLGAAVRRKNHA